MLNCETCQQLLADALYGEPGLAEQKQIARHLRECRACRGLHSEMQTAAALLTDKGLTAGRYDDIHGHARLDGLWDALQPALNQVDAERLERRHSRGFKPFLAGAVAMAASVLVFIFVFDLSIQTGSGPVETATTAGPETTSNAELMSYLSRAETMLLTVANAHSQDVSGVPIRQTFARDMAAEAGLLNASMEGSFNSGQTRLLRDIESMLMQIANLDEGNMEEGVRLLQRYIEDNSILFRIRLMEMCESENVI